MLFIYKCNILNIPSSFLVNKKRFYIWLTILFLPILVLFLVFLSDLFINNLINISSITPIVTLIALFLISLKSDKPVVAFYKIAFLFIDILMDIPLTILKIIFGDILLGDLKLLWKHRNETEDFIETIKSPFGKIFLISSILLFGIQIYFMSIGISIISAFMSEGFSLRVIIFLLLLILSFLSFWQILKSYHREDTPEQLKQARKDAKKAEEERKIQMANINF